MARPFVDSGAEFYPPSLPFICNDTMFLPENLFSLLLLHWAIICFVNATSSLSHFTPFLMKERFLCMKSELNFLCDKVMRLGFSLKLSNVQVAFSHMRSSFLPYID